MVCNFDFYAGTFNANLLIELISTTFTTMSRIVDYKKLKPQHSGFPRGPPPWY